MKGFAENTLILTRLSLPDTLFWSYCLLERKASRVRSVLFIVTSQASIAVSDKERSSRMYPSSWTGESERTGGLQGWRGPQRAQVSEQERRAEQSGDGVEASGV